MWMNVPTRSKGCPYRDPISDLTREAGVLSLKCRPRFVPFEDRPDLIGAFALKGVHRDVVGRSVNNITAGEVKRCQPTRSAVRDGRACC